MLTAEEERKKLHEAIWKKSCSRTHRLWCSCPDWTSHIRCRTPELPTTEEGDDIPISFDIGIPDGDASTGEDGTGDTAGGDPSHTIQ
ncbi:MAG: ORF2 protein [Anelloviridae sp.]|uniref:ORF2 protein n=1 Tax=Anelloviridae sp. TaxID=2055263 RepID=A0A3G2YTA7_9VIRU|nr:MAG: ORF2 protein [Anelloviridae sp.]AYP28924.1 MAG: ORF2 protein [Anelloviridae sp.]